LTSSRPWRASATALVVAAALLATWPAWSGAFVYDDQYYVVDNPAVQGEASPRTEPLGLERQALWRPLTVASYRIQWDGPSRASGMLCLNMALHAAVAVLILALGRQLGLGRGGSFAAALLFAAHPVHAEAVAWVTGRSELLVTLFVVAAWCAHVSVKRGAAVAAALLLALAALSKENALVALPLFVLMDLALARRPAPVRRWLGLGAVLAVVAGARALVLPDALPLDAPFGEVPFVGRLLVAAHILGRAVGLLAWPDPLSVFYPRSQFLGVQPALLSACVGLVALVVAVRRASKTAAVCLALIPVSLGAVLQLMPIGATFGERFLYLPSVLACLALGGVLEWLGRRELASGRGLGASVLLPALALACAIPASRSAVAVFHDDVSLWAHAAAVRPDVAHTRYNHGHALQVAGRVLALDSDHPGAAEEYRASLRIDPRHLYAGHAHQQLGIMALAGSAVRPPDVLDAARHFRAAIASPSGPLEARLNLAAIAAAAPQLVTPSEGLAVLLPLRDATGLDAERAAAVRALIDQLAAAAVLEAQSTGTSSPDGS
jgi:hypothetical protein